MMEAGLEPAADVVSRGVPRGLCPTSPAPGGSDIPFSTPSNLLGYFKPFYLTTALAAVVTEYVRPDRKLLVRQKLPMPCAPSGQISN